MRIKKEFWLVLGIAAFVLWVIIISMCVIDLYDTQNVLIKCMETVQEILLEIEWL